MYDKSGKSMGRQTALFELEEFRVFVEVDAPTWRNLSATKLCIVENESGLIFAGNPQKLDTDSIVLYDTDIIEVSHEINILGKEKPIVYTDEAVEGPTKKLVFNRDL